MIAHEFCISLDEGSQSSLEAHAPLQMVDNEATFHIALNLRPALGIYNVSTSRVLQKIEDLAEKIETTIRIHPKISDHKAKAKIERELIDYIELAFYAAADHVDDLELIVDGFFPDKMSSKRSLAFRAFKAELKSQKAFIAAVANHIKHSQHRIRLFQLEYAHASVPGVMYGYIVEGVSNGVVGPSDVFHDSHRSVFSMTSLVWEIVLFVMRASRILKHFLLSTNLLEGPAATSCAPLTDALIAAARLPLYGMDEDSPFSSTNILITWDQRSIDRADSGIYGAVLRPWEHHADIRLGRCGASFAGDGITRQFRMLVRPTRIALHRLDHS